MIFEDIANVMNARPVKEIMRKTGLTKNRVYSLRMGCTFHMDYELLFALQRDTGFALGTRRGAAVTGRCGGGCWPKWSRTSAGLLAERLSARKRANKHRPRWGR